MQWGKSKITAVPLPWPLQEREAFFYFFIYLWWWWGFFGLGFIFPVQRGKKKRKEEEARHDLTSKNTAIHFCDSTKAKAPWFSSDGAPRQRPCLTVAVDGLITTILQMIKGEARLFVCVCKRAASPLHLAHRALSEPRCDNNELHCPKTLQHFKGWFDRRLKSAAP